MEGVTTKGTARGIPKIPGINICAKTGTAENKKVIEGKVVQLKDHSLFVCFAPREDPKIAVAVIVENGGFGATWAGPMAYLMVEKYLTDSLRMDRMKEVDRIAAANLLPDYLTREQFREDSIRAYKWFEMTNDSSYIEKFITLGKPRTKSNSNNSVPKPWKKPEQLALLPDDKQWHRAAMR